MLSLAAVTTELGISGRIGSALGWTDCLGRELHSTVLAGKVSPFTYSQGLAYEVVQLVSTKRDTGADRHGCRRNTMHWLQS